MTTTTTSQRQPDLNGQTVVVIGGGAGIGLQAVRERFCGDLPKQADRMMVTAAGPAVR